MKNKGVTLMTKSLCQKAMLLCISIISKEFLVNFEHSHTGLILILHDNIGNIPLAVCESGKIYSNMIIKCY